MATIFTHSLRNVKPGRKDWIVKVRVIREWRGVTTTGEPFKSFYLILLDAQNCRMQATVPAAVTDRISRDIQEGKIYLIKDFMVKAYTNTDKFRPVEIDRHIIFTTDTKAKELDETEVFIPKNMFDLFQFDDLKKMATQVHHLIDVVGVIKKKGKCIQKENKNGKVQTQMKFKLTDGRNKINVTLWDTLAEQFEMSLAENLEEPIILIIASGRITSWNDQIDICNYSPTKVYLNYHHHSVIQLRNMLKNPEFDKGVFNQKTKTFRVCTIEETTKLGTEFIQDEIICKVTINMVDVNQIWKIGICTSCYNETELEAGTYLCKHCPRIVSEPHKKFRLSTVASDATGVLKILLRDREVKTILGQDVFEFEKEGNTFQHIINTIQAKDYTVKLLIKEENLKEENTLYEATGIFMGFIMDEETVSDKDKIQHSECSTAQPSGSSYHLDSISQLEYSVE